MSTMPFQGHQEKGRYLPSGTAIQVSKWGAGTTVKEVRAYPKIHIQEGWPGVERTLQAWAWLMCKHRGGKAA